MKVYNTIILDIESVSLHIYNTSVVTGCRGDL